MEILQDRLHFFLCKWKSVVLKTIPWLLAGLVSCGNSFAAVRSVQCSSCSEERVESAAIGQGVGQRYVHDLGIGSLRKFQVTREPGHNGQFVHSAVEIAAEAANVAAFLDLKDFYDANGRRWILSVRGRADVAKSGEASGFVSAWDAVDPGAIQNRVSAHLENNWYSGLVLGMSGYFYSAAAATKLIDINAAPQLTIDVIFTDGSQMTFKYDLNMKKFVYVKGTAKDSQGNNIPDSKTDIARTDGTQRYYFDGPNGTQDRARAIERFRQFGVPISGGSVWACVSGGGTVTCQVVR